MKSDLIQKELITKLAKGKKILGNSFFPGGEVIVQAAPFFFAVFGNNKNVPDTQFYLNSSILTDGLVEYPNDAMALYEGRQKIELHQTGLLKFGRDKKTFLRQLVKRNHKGHVTFTAWVSNRVFSYFKPDAQLTFIRSQTTSKTMLYLYENGRLCGLVIPEEVEERRI
jgi:hypothetical protein